MLTFNIPPYDDAMRHLAGQVINGFHSLDPILGKMSLISSPHHGPIRNVRGSVPLDQDFMPITAEASLAVNTIRNSIIDEHTVFLCKLAQESIASAVPQFFKGIDEITRFTGNTVDVAGNPFSWKDYNSALEKMPIPFDEKGEPILPTLIMHPNLFNAVKNIKPTPEEERQFSDLISQKRAEFNAKKRTRRLS